MKQLNYERTISRNLRRFGGPPKCNVIRRWGEVKREDARMCIVPLRDEGHVRNPITRAFPSTVQTTEFGVIKACPHFAVCVEVGPARAGLGRATEEVKSPYAFGRGSRAYHSGNGPYPVRGYPSRHVDDGGRLESVDIADEAAGERILWPISIDNPLRHKLCNGTRNNVRDRAGPAESDNNIEGPAGGLQAHERKRGFRRLSNTRTFLRGSGCP